LFRLCRIGFVLVSAFLVAGIIPVLFYSFSVLVFPPFPSRLRFLIHRTLEKTPDLATFSVGELWRRRVVNMFHIPSFVSSGCRQRRRRKSQTNSRRGFTAEPGHKRGRGARRPDKAIYVPRALKERDSHISALQHQRPYPDLQSVGTGTVPSWSNLGLSVLLRDTMVVSGI
uniref:R3H domain-containing protein n=1 Tax=Denticeps clupeoides TaxID=299321 RepID=A0AAY4AKQ1_9TELE